MYLQKIFENNTSDAPLDTDNAPTYPAAHYLKRGISVYAYNFDGTISNIFEMTFRS